MMGRGGDCELRREWEIRGSGGGRRAMRGRGGMRGEMSRAGGRW